MTIRRFAQILFAASALLSLAALVVAGLAEVNHLRLAESQRSRHESYLLADELRRSSDDLTRFARTYVSTGEEKYARFYSDVLAIRNGEKPRPDHYERIYWDFVADGRPVAGVGRAVSLRQLMREAGFSQDELAMLTEAEIRSDALVKTEAVAMHAMKGEYADAAGAFTRRAPADQALAIRLMNDDAYHHQKALIMEPIDRFLAMVDARTAASLDAYTRRGALDWRLIEAIVATLIGLLAIAFPLARSRVFEPVSALQEQTAIVAADLGRLATVARQNAQGHGQQMFTVASAPIRSVRRDEIGDLSRLHDSMIGQLQEAGASIANLTSDLRSAKEAADRASRAKSAFLATISHEIRTPMHAILGYAQLLKSEPSLDEAQQQKLRSILKSGDRLLMLINNVLEMSTLEAGRATLAVEPIDLRSLLHELHQMFAPLTRAKGVTLEFGLANDLPPTVDGDPEKIRQVVVNLLSNATKFTDHGRIALRASSTPTTTGSDTISIAVEDTGGGIAPEYLAKIFHAFEQTSGPFPSGGAGLGLTVSREIARLMRGDVTVLSRRGVGSTFTFTFDARVTSRDAGRTRQSRFIVDEEPHNEDVTAAAESLPDLLRNVPADLIAQLREAVIGARAARIELFAAQIGEHSAEGASLIRALARDFQYDELASALSEGTQPDS